jgi:hypothetical protein
VLWQASASVQGSDLTVAIDSKKKPASSDDQGRIDYSWAAVDPSTT